MCERSLGLGARFERPDFDPANSVECEVLVIGDAASCQKPALTVMGSASPVIALRSPFFGVSTPQVNAINAN